MHESLYGRINKNLFWCLNKVHYKIAEKEGLVTLIDVRLNFTAWRGLFQ